MGKGWGPDATGAGYTSKRFCSTTPGLCGWLPVGQPNVECRVPSSAYELRWTLEMVAAVEVAEVRLSPAVAPAPTLAPVPALACSTSQ